MANIVVKTIWQSKEINEAGDTPTGAESRAQGSKEQLGKPNSVNKGFAKKKKAVSFHGVEPHMTNENPNLNLKRSSACTNVSLLNLTDGERDDSTTENESTDDGGPPGGAGGERRDLLPPVKSAWSEDEDDTSSQQSECSALCENLERRRQEAEDLEEYCTHLKESCRKVTKTVEDAEVKTNVLKKTSVLLEEKLRFLQRQVQAEDLSRQEREWQELEQRVATGVSKQLMEVASSTGTMSLKSPGFEELDLQWSTATILASINSLRGALENGQLRAGPGEEGGVPINDGKLATASTLACIPLLEEIRKCVAELTGRSQRDGLTQKEMLRLLAQLGVRLEGVLPQWERIHVEHGQTLRMLREELDEVSATAKRTSLSLTQLRADLDGLWQVKPLLEDVSRHLSALKGQETPDRLPTSCARCASYSFVNTEALRQMVEHAMAPVLEELKQRASSPGLCPSCQRLQKKIMDLERSAVDTHARVETLNSNVRLAQDEALRVKNYLERTKLNPEDNVSGMGYLQSKLNALQSQLSLTTQEGAPQSQMTVALTKRSSCPAELSRDSQ
ncbi:testis-specific serine kinase substrate isoform X2 [Hemicordylus capensis]|uniref:testis-specific serine kinase substrate isoform X2 n=1 Tax=Hemicordylus capensis TaxID=884348 RepID=UPI002302B7CF|nr:testis-specific serine kinase substrate isoform X2 [Hemicordylus capensis]